MGVPDEVQQIAMSLDEMLAAAENYAVADLPEAGGDYDTNEGWKKRLGVSSVEITKLLAWAESQVLAKRGVMGRVKRGRGWYPIDLVHSPTLAKRCLDK